MAHIHNIEDFKNNAGEWVKSKTWDGNTYHTRASVLWNNIKKRSGVVGNYKELNKSYSTCQNLFNDFQEFATWCQMQIGYNCKDQSGNFCTLDKDLIGDGNYHPDGCVFIPHEINVVFTNVQKKNGRPLGICMDRGSIRSKQGSSDLGYFKDQMDAHKAWQKSKLGRLEDLISKWENSIDSRVVEKLDSSANILRYDIENDLETLYL